MDNIGTIALFAGVAFASCAAGCLSEIVLDSLSRHRAVRKLRARIDTMGTSSIDVSGIPPLTFSLRILLKLAGSLTRIGTPNSLRMKSTEIDVLSVDQAGLVKQLNPRILPALRWYCSSIVAIVVSLTCLPVSGFLAFSAFLIGGCIGHRWPMHVLKRTAEHRRSLCERELPVMIGIVALCIRAGTSFDSSVETYCERFDSLLAHECRKVHLEYSQGLASREDSWRRLAAELEISSLNRFVETTLQAIHFGAPLACVLLELSADIRKECKARTTERIAKAPVKMLIPTGVLILPAMLLFVMGPMVLNLTNELM